MKENEQCKRCHFKDDIPCRTIKEDKHLRYLKCPCFVCLVKLHCREKCHQQYIYIQRRFNIAMYRYYHIYPYNKEKYG